MNLCHQEMVIHVTVILREVFSYFQYLRIAYQSLDTTTHVNQCFPWNINLILPCITFFLSEKKGEMSQKAALFLQITHNGWRTVCC